MKSEGDRYGLLFLCQLASLWPGALMDGELHWRDCGTGRAHLAWSMDMAHL